MAIGTGWQSLELDPRKILLDKKNPRIEVGPSATQAEIRQKLVETEDVIDLARRINNTGGLSPGERIITTIEDNKHVVLEGNRRVTACQFLLDRKLLPAELAERFPIATSTTKANIRRVFADVAPTRDAAEPILTRRHTERSAKPWTPAAKMRRAARLIEDGHSFEDAADLLGTSPARVRALIRPYKLLRYAINFGGWTEPEQRALENEKLITNPYTRLFTLRPTKLALRISFDDDQDIRSDLPPELFAQQMERIIRDFLIPDPETGRPKFDTRADVAEYFAEFVNSPEGKAAGAIDARTYTGKPPAGRGGGKGDTGKGKPHNPKTPKAPKTPKSSIFFEHLVCHVQDDNLLCIMREIKRIDTAKMTLAATLLTRALLESALSFKVRQNKKWNDLQKKSGHEPTLKDLIKYCANSGNGIFAENKICQILGSPTIAHAKDYLDSVVHMKYMQADEMTLLSTANNLRAIIQYILEGH